MANVNAYEALANIRQRLDNLHPCSQGSQCDQIYQEPTTMTEQAAPPNTAINWFRPP